MAPKKCSTIATRPATAPWNVAKKPQLEANIHRMNELKARYAAVSKALKPALLEIANRTAGELQNDTRYHQTSANKRQFDQVQSELKGALDRGVSSISAVTKIKMAAVQRKTEYDMWLVEQECKAKVESIRKRYEEQVKEDLKVVQRSCWFSFGLEILESGDFFHVDSEPL